MIHVCFSIVSYLPSLKIQQILHMCVYVCVCILYIESLLYVFTCAPSLPPTNNGLGFGRKGMMETNAFK